MGKQTNIQWADRTFSPWRGCAKVNDDCKNCYIYETSPLRVRGQKSGDPRVRASAGAWDEVRKWNRDISTQRREGAETQRLRVFPSLCDWLDEVVPIKWLVDFLSLICWTENLNWLLLTKRPENFRRRMEQALEEAVDQIALASFILGWLDGSEPPHNVWVLASAGNQKNLETMLPPLLKIPARVRGLSIEPMTGSVDLSSIESTAWPQLKGRPALWDIDWVIVGGESGPRARPCNVEWIRKLKLKCCANNTPVFVKQLGATPVFGNGSPLVLKHSKGGEWAEWPEDLRVREFPKVTARVEPRPTASVP